MPSSLPLADWLWTSRMRRPFCILSVLGDVLDEGELHFVGTAKTMTAARRRIKALGHSRPGEYVIYNQRTGERQSIEVGAGSAVERWPNRVGIF